MSVARLSLRGALALVSTSALFAVIVLCAAPVGAQTLGTFSWQLQPYCNRVVLTATQQESVIALSGYDDRCGTGPRAPITGVAFPNPDGTIGLGLSGIATPLTTAVSFTRSVAPIYATVSAATLSGTWQDTQTPQGTFAFGSATGGPRRPQHAIFIDAIDFEDGPALAGYSASGTADAPGPVAASRALADFWGGGFDGVSLAVAAGMRARTTEAWTPSAHGTELLFLTTPEGSTGPLSRVRIAANGAVAIGSQMPLDALDVEGDVRLGTSGTNGCLKNKSGGALIGTCSSDARFKRDVTPFAAALEAVAALRPVHYYWRSAEFPHKGFGSERAYGLIAQDVAAVLPEIVSTDQDGYQTIDYAKLPLLAIQAIKELKDKNDALEQRLTAIESRLVPR